MRTSTKQEAYQCRFPDYDDPGFSVDVTSHGEAAELAAERWESAAGTATVRDGEEVLDVEVTRLADSKTEMQHVLGVHGQYCAKRY